MRHTPTIEASNFVSNQAKTIEQSFENTLKDCTMVSVKFLKNKKLPWLGSVSSETWYPKVRFEYWTISLGYLRAFCQSLIFIVFSYIFEIKNKKQLKWWKFYETRWTFWYWYIKMAEFCDRFKLLTACQWQIEIFIQSSLLLTVPKEHPVWNVRGCSVTSARLSQ